MYRLPGPLDLSGLTGVADLDLRRLKFPAFVPSEAAIPQDASVFSVLTERDVLVHHPYDSFTATVRAAGGGGRRGPPGAGHQADPLPHQRRLADRGRAHRRGRGGQAGRGGGGDQGQVRRAGQHRLGAEAGGSRLPRRLRVRRAEDALQDAAGGTRGAGRLAAPVLPHRHRQLPPDHRPAVRGLRAAHHRPGGRAGRDPTCSTTSPGTAARASTTGCWSPRPRCGPAWWR